MNLTTKLLGIFALIMIFTVGSLAITQDWMLEYQVHKLSEKYAYGSLDENGKPMYCFERAMYICKDLKELGYTPKVLLGERSSEEFAHAGFEVKGIKFFWSEDYNPLPENEQQIFGKIWKDYVEGGNSNGYINTRG